MLPWRPGTLASHLKCTFTSVIRAQGVSGLLPCSFAPWSCTPLRFLMLGASRQDDGTKKISPSTQQEKVSGGATGTLFSLFTAGAARKRAGLAKRKIGNKLIDVPKIVNSAKTRVPMKPLSIDEWKKMKAEMNNKTRFEVSMMEKLLSNHANIDIAKSLLVYVTKETGTVDYELLLKYLALCVKGNHLNEVLDLYGIMKTKFETLDTGAYSLFINGFSKTDRWKEAMIFLDSIKKMINPSPRNYGDIIISALQHKEVETAWSLLKEMEDLNLRPNEDTLQAFFDCGKSPCDERYENMMLNILSYLRDNQIYPGESLMQSIQSWFESLPGKRWVGHKATIAHSGKCHICNTLLETIQLNEDEYSVLKEHVMNDVIQGKDVFRKTTPALFDVVSHLARQNLRILVLGRRHMLKGTRSWDKGHMAAIQKYADCFFTSNISEDDPFLLYATILSGNHCKFLSRDLMRDHKACMPDKNTRRLFFKWQRGHQLVLSGYNPGHKMKFEVIPNYDTIVQSTRNTWHIPYEEKGVERSSYEVPRKWLCLQKCN
ncbi:mitochondrial ribonuclease P catalytic subunit isoform X2 [Hypanus sabinus]|uniref:mitochondrial ribonuclease P catalytic subunit isoform X2 n=1 Tax=Hypanus sabinus TaxID=79690 RepID=UPI0028C38589|nr:mitochondrial ribonuclease P catalytic subunit isoform X2 [Hypanus sabinus]